MAVVAVHHLDTGSFRVRSERLVRAGGAVLRPARCVTHCLLLETDRDGLVLVDVGFGTRDVARPARVPATVRFELRPAFDPAQLAAARVRALGFLPSDVRHVVFTHLDRDHASGLADFPDATAHAVEDELQTALRARSFVGRTRYGPGVLRAHRRWTLSPQGGEHWFAFDGVRPLEALAGDVAFVPLPGHTRAHAGVAVRHGDRWLLHAGDAYLDRTEVEAPPSAPSRTGWHQLGVEADRAARRDTVHRLRELRAAHGDQVTVFCSHDASEHAALAGASA